MNPIRVYLLERTGRMTPYEDGVSRPIFIDTRTGKEVTSRTADPGGVYFISKEDNPALSVGQDGLQCWVILPNRNFWCVDSRASNCTKKDDWIHRCWVRHGSIEEVRNGTLHVDKDGCTCAAGAGSIVMGGWHGFLHHGHLVSC